MKKLMLKRETLRKLGGVIFAKRRRRRRIPFHLHAEHYSRGLLIRFAERERSVLDFND